MADLVKDIRTPIFGENPCGEDLLRLTPSQDNQEWIQEYGRFRELRRRVTTNCEDLVGVTRRLLTEKSKDLDVAGYLCMALLHHRGIGGLAEGLEGYRALMEEYWEGMYPAKEAVRAKRFESLDQYLADAIVAKDPTGQKYRVAVEAKDREVLEGIKETVDQIEGVWWGRKPDEDEKVTMKGLRASVDQRLSELPAPADPPPSSEPQPASTSVPPTTASSTVRPSAAVAQPSGPAEITDRRGAVEWFVRAADFLLEKYPSDVGSYRLRRSLWDLCFLPPPHDEEGVVQGTSPPSGKSRLEELLRDKNWESLVKACEAAFVEDLVTGTSALCLDIQRILCIALEELIKMAEEGGDANAKAGYEAVHKLVLQEMAIFAERYPKVVELRYGDRTPFADGQTREWIEKTVKPLLSTGTGAQGPAARREAEDGPSEISEELDKAKDLLSKQQWAEALDLMQQGIDRDPTRKGRFLRRQNLADLCLNAERPEMARPLLEQLDEEIERFSLDQWEPGLCLGVWNALQRCYQALLSQQAQQGQQGGDGLYREKADRVFEKICRLDIREVQA